MGWYPLGKGLKYVKKQLYDILNRHSLFPEVVYLSALPLGEVLYYSRKNAFNFFFACDKKVIIYAKGYAYC